MAETKGFRPAEVFSPGEFLLDEITARDWQVPDAARALRMPEELVIAILNGRQPVTPGIALRLQRGLGIERGFWLRTQALYDAHVPNPGGRDGRA
jgi:addiction module HigA family antidote